METWILDNIDGLKDNPLFVLIVAAFLLKKYVINGLAVRWREHLTTLEAVEERKAVSMEVVQKVEERKACAMETAERLKKIEVIELGRLRKSLHSYLKEHSEHVDSFGADTAKYSVSE